MAKTFHPHRLIPTFSPQGDGNGGRPGIPRHPRLQLIPTFSPQGDGNRSNLKEKWSGVPSTLIPTFSPQGDGNTSARTGRPRKPSGSVDPYLFPARGRKRPQLKALGLEGLRLIPTFSPQGDGNFCNTSRRWANWSSRLIPTFSPQGDGNTTATLASVIRYVAEQGVDPYLFPARGRKRRSHLPMQSRGRQVDPYLFPARGRKRRRRRCGYATVGSS